jgi:eukaryotic-like serine/threonine-protein kinase
METMRTDGESRCQRCGAPGAFAAADGLCPGCLLESALVPRAEDESNETEVIGDTCGPYQIERVIGRGGNGIVFLARKPGANRPVAIKMLASARLAGPDGYRRFRLEATAAMELEHPHIIRVHDSGEEDGAPWFAMDYAEGGSLHDLLAQSGERIPEDLRRRVEMMSQVARAVHFAHERGVLHRDLKPANILIDGEGNPLVADFGLARLIHSPSGVTMTGAALGTPGYMAPEQAAGNAITTAADVYSLGAMLFHLLTGRPPFDAPTPLETLRLVTSRDAPDPRSAAPWIDRDLATVCLKALRRERGSRYESAAALADDLDAWLRGDPVKARPLALPEKLVKWCRRHPIAATLTATSAVATLVLGSVLVTGSIMLRKERNHALRQEAAALTYAAAATRARDESRLQSYASDIYLAFRAFDDGHLGLARRMLHRQIAGNGLQDLRGFEWHALARRCRGDDLISWHDHQGAVCAVAFSPDGKRLASGSRDGLLVIRSVPDGRTVLTLPKPDAPRGAAEIPMMTAVIARSADAAKFLLAAGINPDELRMRARPSKLGEITTLAWSPDGKRIATAGLGSYVRVWTLPQGDLTGIIPIRTATSLAFTPDGKFLVTHLHCEDEQYRHECRIHRTDDLSLHHVIRDLNHPHALSPADGVLATIAKSGTDITLTHPQEGRAIATIRPGTALKRIVFSNDGRVLHGTDVNGSTVGSWSVATGERTGTMFPVADAIDLMEPSPCGSFFASTGSAQRIAWQHGSGAAPAVLLGGHEDVIRALDVSPDGAHLASGGNDHSVRLWRTTSASTQAVADPFPALDPPASIRAMAAGPALTARAEIGYWIGDGEGRGEFRLVSREGKTLRRIDAPKWRYLRLYCSPDGSRLAIFLWPRGLRVLADDGRSWSDEWKLSPGTVGPVVFSPDGTLLASGGDDNTVSIRDSRTGKLIAQLKGHQGGIIDLAFTPDGRTLASIAEDKTLRLWHCATWRDLGTLHHGERLERITFGSSGLTLHARSANGIREFGAVPD